MWLTPCGDVDIDTSLTPRAIIPDIHSTDVGLTASRRMDTGEEMVVPDSRIPV